jgi:methionyl-tRNA formyltransferase
MAPTGGHRVAFLGTPAVAVPALSALVETRDVAAVFCNPDRPSNRGQSIVQPPVKAAALKLGLGVFQPEKWGTDEAKALWEDLGIDMALVVAYGHMLPPWMLDGCRYGAWNLHFSLLPRWRGAAPVNHAVMTGDGETGVSLMKMTPGLDAGPVLAQCRRPIGKDTDARVLLADLAEDAVTLLKDHLDAIFCDPKDLIPQDENLVTLAPKLKKEMAILDTSKGAIELHRRIRGLQPWPGAEVRLEGTVLKILEVGNVLVSDASPGTLQWDREGAWLTVGGGSAIELVSLQRPGKPVQTARQALQPWGGKGRLMVM